MIARYFGLEPLVVDPAGNSGMPILYENPSEVGADRIVMRSPPTNNMDATLNSRSSSAISAPPRRSMR
jgi:hypothetical protein